MKINFSCFVSRFVCPLAGDFSFFPLVVLTVPNRKKKSLFYIVCLDQVFIYDGGWAPSANVNFSLFHVLVEDIAVLESEGATKGYQTSANVSYSVFKSGIVDGADIPL